jgi:hypothetical protein
MNARLMTAAAVATVLCGVLPARAADSALLNLMMPDAKVIAGVNVDQAKVSPFGQWVLGQMQLHGNEINQLTTLTGFDPTRDVHELMVATSATAGTQHSGLLAARGNFDPAKINALALTKAGAVSETYNGVIIVEDAKQTSGFAFLDSTLVIAGDLANVKAALDRTVHPTSLPASVATQIQTWSQSQDAWALTTVPPGTLAPNPGMPPIPGLGTGTGSNPNNAFQNIQQLAGGVKFGASVVVTGQAQAATAQDATQMGDVVKLLASLAQMQSNADPKLTALLQSLKVAPSGSTLNVTLSLPQDMLVQLLKQSATPQTHPNVRRPGAPVRKM